VKFELVDAEKANFPVGVLCDVLDVSRSGFYAWKQRPSSAHSKADTALTVEVKAAHTNSGKRYGSPRIHRALRKKGVRSRATSTPSRRISPRAAIAGSTTGKYVPAWSLPRA